MKRVLLIAVFIIAGKILFAQPVIGSFSPQAALPGSVVTVSGSGFSPVADSNIVFFGPVKGKTLTASATQLTVQVPVSAAFSLISVTSGGLTGYSRQYFDLTTGFTITQIDSNSFEPVFVVPVNGFSNNFGLTVYDVDDDGKPDLASSDSSSRNNIYFFRNTAVPGTINRQSLAPQLDFTSGDYSNAPFLFADLNNDGKKDLITAGAGTVPVRIFNNSSTTGNISFSDSIEVIPGSFFSDVIADGDLDGDGKTDLVTITRNNRYDTFNIRVLKNETQQGGSFNFTISPSMATLTGNNTINVLAVADMNGDGKPDILYAPEYGSKLYVLQNTSTPGNLSFAVAVNFTTDIRNEEIAIGDLNNDGLPDIILSGQQNYISVFKNSSTLNNLALTPEPPLPTSSPVVDIVINDFDGDGKPDVAATALNYYTDVKRVAIFKNTGTADSIHFSQGREIKLPNYMGSISSADIDGDGKQDIVTGGYSPMILRNKMGVANLGLCSGRSNTSMQTSLTGTSYQWQLSSDGINYYSVQDDTTYSGTNTATLQITALNSYYYGYHYRCLVNGSSYDKIITITVKNTWTGAVNTNWENPANWSCNKVPDINTDVVIPGGVVLLNSNASCRTLSVAPGASFTVGSGFTLTVTH